MTDEPSSRRKRTPRPSGPRSESLADVLERVLETGIVIAGDIKVNLTDIELLTIQIRLVVCSVERAEEMGMDWWKNAHYLNADDSEPLDSEGGGRDEQLDQLDERLDRLEQTLADLESNP